jgi:queuine/archaeosine tRNA-ribosyltransferase
VVGPDGVSHLDNALNMRANFFPIVQGSTYKDLRNNQQNILPIQSTRNAGGLICREPAEEMYAMTEGDRNFTRDKTKYLMVWNSN